MPALRREESKAAGLMMRPILKPANLFIGAAGSIIKIQHFDHWRSGEITEEMLGVFKLWALQSSIIWHLFSDPISPLFYVLAAQAD